MNVIDALLDVIKGLDSRTGLILKSLVEHDKLGFSVADLARQIGSTPSSTLRDVNRLIDLGLVRSEDEGRAHNLHFNYDSPFAEPLLNLVFVAYGVRPAAVNPPTKLARAIREDDGVTQSSIVNFVPPELTGPRGLRSMYDRGGHSDPPAGTFNGPSPEAARALILQIEPFREAVRGLEGNLQTAHYRWREERDRDLIHVVLHAGEGSGYASTHLRWGSKAAQARSESAISDLEWARGVYGMWAEAQTCHGIADYLDGILDDRYEWLRAKDKVKDAQRDLDILRRTTPEERAAMRPGTYERLEMERVETVTQAERRVADLEKQFPGRYRGPGPLEKDVGLAGERWLASAARGYGDWAQSLAVDMAEHDSFQAWKGSNPEVLVKFPGPPDRLTEPTTI